MNVKKLVLAIVAIAVNVGLVLALSHRLPLSVAQGIGFWVMFLILPINYSRDDMQKNTVGRKIVGATIGALIGMLISGTLTHWK